MESLTYSIRADGTAATLDDEAFSLLLLERSSCFGVPTIVDDDVEAGDAAVATRPRRVELRGNCMRHTLHGDNSLDDVAVPVLSLEQASRLLSTLLVSRRGLDEVTIWGGRDWSGNNDGAVRRLLEALAISDPIRLARADSNCFLPTPRGCCLRELWLLHPSSHGRDSTILHMPADVASTVFAHMVRVLSKRCLPCVEVLVMDGWMASHQSCQDVMGAAGRHLPRLETLRLCGNRIRSIENDVIHSVVEAKDLHTLILSGNPQLGHGTAGPKSLARLMERSSCGHLRTLALQACGIGTTAMSDHLVDALSSPGCQLHQLQLEGNPMRGELLGAKLVAALRTNVRIALGIDPSAFGKHGTQLRELQRRNRLFHELGQRFDSECRTGGSEGGRTVPSSFSSTSDRSMSPTVQAHKEWVLDYLPLLSTDHDMVRSTSLYWVLRSAPDRLRCVAASIADQLPQEKQQQLLVSSSRASALASTSGVDKTTGSSVTFSSSGASPPSYSRHHDDSSSLHKPKTRRRGRCCFAGLLSSSSSSSTLSLSRRRVLPLRRSSSIPLRPQSSTTLTSRKGTHEEEAEDETAAAAVAAAAAQWWRQHLRRRREQAVQSKIL